MHALRIFIALAGLALMAGCAFDVVQVRQLPVTLTPLAASKTFVLREPAVVRIGTGFPVNLKAGTTWHSMGTTIHGDAYTTADQVLTVEASNIHEAALVVREDEVTGFYLLIEKKFCPATKPTQLVITPK